MKDLEKTVMRYIEEGYIPQGGITLLKETAENYILLQPMIKNQSE